MILFAEITPVGSVNLNHPWAATDARAHMHFEAVNIEKSQVVIDR